MKNPSGPPGREDKRIHPPEFDPEGQARIEIFYFLTPLSEGGGVLGDAQQFL